MNLILRYLAGRKAAPAPADPHLKAELNQTKKDLNQILSKWKFGDVPIKTSQEFLANFEPWITDQLNQQKDLKVFLAKKGVTNLTEAESKLTNRDLSENEELAQLSQELTEAQQKHEQELAQQEQTFLNTEADYLARIEAQDQELKAKIKEFQASNGELLKRIEELEKSQSAEDHSNPFELESLQLEIKDLKDQLAVYAKGEDWESQTASVIASLEQEVSDLTTERDEAIREKKTAEQDLLATNNRLKNKSQEVDNKSQEIERLKKEKSQVEIALNKTITELRTKYSKQGKLLDTEQLECKKLEEENEKLKAEIQQLKGGSH